MSLPRREEREISGDTFPLPVSLSLVPPASLLLSLHLSPSSLGFLRKITTWLLTLIFQHLSECDRLSFVSPPSSCVPTSIHPPTPFSLPAPTHSCRLLIVPPTVQLLPCDRREEDRKKTKTNQAQTEASLPGYQAVSLCLLVRFMTRTRPWTYNEERYRFTLMYATHTHAQA